MGRKLSKSDITLTRDEEIAQRERAALRFAATTCQHFAPGTHVTLANETFEVIEADAARTTLVLRAADGSQRTVLRPGA